ncbi:hypothetical protein [Streptomyces sp. NBC_01304]|uniref:hypothetical protein n=1 Tax=Streptomyces sp. NBC_01304 TaxID=2903818 RepID=UPI002E0E22AD|nr:hypothetical protein OG430_47705 [Streptomyces sp. NBC_01304]
MSDDDERTVAVDMRALSVDGYGSLHRVPRGTLLRLEEDALGMSAGLWRASWDYSRGTYPGCLRDLQQVAQAETGTLTSDGTRIHTARRAADWTSEFPVLVQGLTVGDLRTALDSMNLPDDTLVAIGAATHPQDFIGSPASARVETGFYEPHPVSGLLGLATGGAPEADADGAIPLHLPALVLYPTH